MHLDWPKIRRKTVSFLRWCFLIWFYLSLIEVSLHFGVRSLSDFKSHLSWRPLKSVPADNDVAEAYDDESAALAMEQAKAFEKGILAWCALGLLFGYVMVRMREERRLIGGNSDRFRGGNLFFRYGVELFNASFPVSFDRSWSLGKVVAFTDFIQIQLAQAVREKLPVAIEMTAELPVSNLSTEAEKKFMRLLARTSRGSLVAQFLHFETIGHTLTVHHLVFARGLERPSEILRFILESPFRIWFWLLPQALSRYSILAKVSWLEDDSFDLIELQSRYQTINLILWEETISILQEAGVLTADLAQMVVNNFSAAQQVTVGANSPIISVSNSPKAKINRIGSIGSRGG